MNHKQLQWTLLIVSATAALLMAQQPPLQKWGFIVGLCSQPFWLMATWRAKQWGMFALAVWYTGVWSLGIYNHWIAA